VQPHELLNLRHIAKGGEIFFRERSNTKTTQKNNVSSHQSTQQKQKENEKNIVSTKEIFGGWEKLLGGLSSSKEPTAPLGMLAFASFVFESVIKPQSQVRFDCLFHGMTVTIPACHNSVNATYHSVVTVESLKNKRQGQTCT
jgi:hypothetical protein